MNGKCGVVLVGVLLVATCVLGGYFGPIQQIYQNSIDDGYNNQGDYYAKPYYKYEYGVNDHHTGDQKHASESRDDHGVKGQYSLREADGTWRHVSYVADKGGFRANVQRSPAQHPQGYNF